MPSHVLTDRRCPGCHQDRGVRDGVIVCTTCRTEETIPVRHAPAPTAEPASDYEARIGQVSCVATHPSLCPRCGAQADLRCPPTGGAYLRCTRCRYGWCDEEDEPNAHAEPPGPARHRCYATTYCQGAIAEYRGAEARCPVCGTAMEAFAQRTPAPVAPKETLPIETPEPAPVPQPQPTAVLPRRKGR